MGAGTLVFIRVDVGNRACRRSFMEGDLGIHSRVEREVCFFVDVRDPVFLVSDSFSRGNDSRSDPNLVFEHFCVARL